MRRAEELLRGSQALIERGWTQHAEARDREEIEVEPWDPAACSWSLLGALVATMDDYRSSRISRRLSATSPTSSTTTRSQPGTTIPPAHGRT